MAEYKLILPPMGEGIMEATITGWVKNEGDYIKEDDTIVEIATDKVDSDVPSTISGKLLKKLKEVNDICKIGEAFAILEIEDGDKNSSTATQTEISINKDTILTINKSIEVPITISELEKPLLSTSELQNNNTTKSTYYSPLIRSICKKENISQSEIELIQGTGLNGRITKEDLFSYLKNRNTNIEKKVSTEDKNSNESKISEDIIETYNLNASTHISDCDEIIEMDRMRKLISRNMLQSKQISAHVTSFVEADVTNIVLWRNKNKDSFFKNEGVKLTYMPIFIQAIVKAIKDFPMINISVDGDTIIKRKNINIGIATAVPNGNLIVPVIKNADQLSLSGLAKSINYLANCARSNQLKPEDTQGGTYTLSNIGSFGNLAGTPIINQPQAAIMAVGSIVKKPVVIETPQGDMIGIRHMMYISHTYDHRVIDGALGGAFAKKVSDYLEKFDSNTKF
jgi:2-oxoglutarate dehydrogenase E2 component (dihydrolipoamide succinyltransferase)